MHYFKFRITMDLIGAGHQGQQVPVPYGDGASGRRI